MSLGEIREEIDSVDEKLIELLEKRFALVAKLAPYKEQLTDLRREEEILSKIDSSLIKKLYRELFQFSKEFLTELDFSFFQNPE